MAKPCKKCDPHEICEECPEWIFTLADLIMCMMGLFVILWVLKPGGTNASTSAAAAQQQSQEWLEVVGEIRAGFGYVPDPNSGDPVDQAMVKKAMRLTGSEEKGTQENPQDAAEGTDPSVQSIREGKLTTVGTRVLFEQGDATLDETDRRILTGIAKVIRGSAFVTIVKGHAAKDDFGEDATPQQLMDVSLRRAQAASDYLVQAGVSPDILRVQGCSTFEPVRQRAYTRALHQENRRVEVFTTDMTVRDLQDQRQGAIRSEE
jgi:outer membrane protein OmpA-like peptidoglycan-associated protein